MFALPRHPNPCLSISLLLLSLPLPSRAAHESHCFPNWNEVTKQQAHMPSMKAAEHLL